MFVNNVAEVYVPKVLDGHNLALFNFKIEPYLEVFACSASQNHIGVSLMIAVE